MNEDTVVAWILLVVAAAWLASPTIIAALIWLDRHNEETDTLRAGDHNEQPRHAIETGWLDEDTEDWWLFPADEFIDTAFQQLREDAVFFAASVMADIDELPGGAA